MVEISVNQAVPDMLVEVVAGCAVSHEGVMHYGPLYPLAPEDATHEPFLLDGPTALALRDAGVVVVRKVEE